jgi:3-oxoacyl-[acyl-carrier protein] reductase
MLGVHVRGAVNTARACLPGMIAQGRGRVLFTASELVGIGMAGLSHYTAAKGALVAMTKSLAREVGPNGVTVNCVAPGPTETRMLMGSEAEYNDTYRKTIPMQEFGTPANVAWTWLFLASDAGRWYTGQVVSPNGGVTM